MFTWITEPGSSRVRVHEKSISLNKNAIVSNAAFTLIELLTVVAIVAILGALLMTAVSRCKAKGQQIACISNLRQAGIALQNFVTDNHAYPSFVGPTNNENSGTWIVQLQKGGFGNVVPFTDDSLKRGVWHCPSAPLKFPISGSPGFSSYGYNSHGVSRPGSSNVLGLRGTEIPGSVFIPGVPESRPRYYPINEAEVTVPSEMMAIGDSFYGDIRLMRESKSRLLMYREDTRREFERAAATRHNGKINVVFCDTHVESPKVEFAFENSSDAALVRWNRDHQPHRNEL